MLYIQSASLYNFLKTATDGYLESNPTENFKKPA